MVAVFVEPTEAERVQAISVPVIDLAWRRDEATKLIVKACEEFGCFKVVNHGISESVITGMEAQGMEFFALPAKEKQRAGPPNPLGYGVKNIGFNGDAGDLEYLILHANPSSVAQKAKSICGRDPCKFSCVVEEYVEAVRELTCDILEMIGEGLGLRNKEAISEFVRENDNDSLLRLNYYPPCCNAKDKDGSESGDRVGFGEHSDPQILTILRSNDVAGLQIVAPSPDGDVWVPVPPDPTAFYVIVGDLLQAMTNGRLISVRHRAMANSEHARRSIMYFAAPPLHARIAPLPETITQRSPCRYRTFTWSEFKKAMYTLRLGYDRLELYRVNSSVLDIDSKKRLHES